MTHAASPRRRSDAGNIDANDAVILIVDDAPDHLAALRKALSQQGYQTFVATSGERALKIARRVLPDLILLDVVMPGMDGLETCRQLKGHAATERIPVIFISARAGTDDIVAGFDSGAVDYIGKPLRLPEVCARVRAQLALRKRHESEKEQAERLRAVIDGMAEGLLIVEGNGRIQYVNPACAICLGYEGSALAGRQLSDLLAAPMAQEYLDYFAGHAADSSGAIRQGAREVQIRQCDGALRAMELTLTPMPARDGLFIGLLHDITRHKQHESALQHAAMIDPLTQIANRRHFDSFMDLEWQRAIRSGQPLSLLVLDVDHFKLYNDTLGHAAGDGALRHVAAVLSNHAMRPTDLAARYGGEEFAVLFAETTGVNAAALAESIRSCIEALQLPHPGSPSGRWLTASIGVASMVPTQLDDIASFFVTADRAMYAAKDAGRNQVQAVDNGNSAWEAVKALVMR